MLDYKINIFLTVADRLSFSKAAEELHITQPAVSRHIKQLEDHFNQKLFERQGNRIALTKAGTLLLNYTKKIFILHGELEFDMNALVDKTGGVLKIAASTTLAQYILPGALANLRKKYPQIEVILTSANTEKVEQQVLKQNAEIGIIEGFSKNRELSYQKFLRDEIVLVVSKNHPLFNNPPIPLVKLKELPLVLREKGSGTLEFIMKRLKENGFSPEQLNIEMRLGSSESIKSYLKEGNCAAFLSINSVLDELKFGSLGIVDIDSFQIDRHFHFIQKMGNHSSLAQLFIDFMTRRYNKTL
ncbi:LysR substrate-binding domain-containing protein [Zunongwangia sp. H14]|uniref:LysR substrate-binding domain-containing protein n=1 Tax=Zunongwangia sp. H14 TaxID=3240792 RepID=UPI003563F43D